MTPSEPAARRGRPPLCRRRQAEPRGAPDFGPIRREDYPGFSERIFYGVWLRDGALELMAPDADR